MSALLLAKLRKLAAGQAVRATGDQGVVRLGKSAVDIIAPNLSIHDNRINISSFGVFTVLSGLNGAIVYYLLSFKIAWQGSEDVSGPAGLAVLCPAIRDPDPRRGKSPL